MAETTLNNSPENDKRHPTELGETLAYSIVIPLTCYATALKETGDHPECTVLFALCRDIERQIAQVFRQINKASPGIRIVPPDDEESITHLFLRG